MNTNLFYASRKVTRNATTSRGRGNLKPSVFKRLKKLVGSSQAVPPQPEPQPEASTSSIEHQRRAEALKSCGLLKQSVKYGAPYRDEEDDAKTIISPATEKRWGDDTEHKKDLIIFDEKILSEKDIVPDSRVGGEIGSVYTPTTPRTRLSVCTSSQSCDSDCTSTVESDTSTLTTGHAPIRIRRIGSLVEEIDQIEDEESKRLTEVAFLS